MRLFQNKLHMHYCLILPSNTVNCKQNFHGFFLIIFSFMFTRCLDSQSYIGEGSCECVDACY